MIKMLKKMGKVLTTVMCIMSILFTAWFVWSWADIVADNCQPNPVHSEYNMFVMLVENAEKN